MYRTRGDVSQPIDHQRLTTFIHKRDCDRPSDIGHADDNVYREDTLAHNLEAFLKRPICVSLLISYIGHVVKTLWCGKKLILLS